VSALLRIAAAVSLVWAAVLLVGKKMLFGALVMPPLGAAFANALALAHLVFAYMFWYAAGAPALHRGAIYGAIMLMALRTANDLYQLLVLLPPDQALLSLGDLVISVALLVGILEALPRLLAQKP
jgi:hypothetical protein